jgi:hypothetical protein
MVFLIIINLDKKKIIFLININIIKKNKSGWHLLDTRQQVRGPNTL